MTKNEDVSAKNAEQTPGPELGPRLAALCAVWQKRLRLQDWDIEIRVRRWNALDSQARCIVTQELKYAEILIRDPADCPEPGGLAYPDLENLLVHEMLHIPFDAANPDCSPSELVALEQALIAVGKCLVSLSRAPVSE